MVDGINYIDKRYIYKLMSNIKLTGSTKFDYQTQMHTSNQNNDVSTAKELQQHLSEDNIKNGVIDQ